MLTELKKPNNPSVSLLVVITEPFGVEEFLSNLERLELPWPNLEIIFYSDGVDESLNRRLSDWLKNISKIVNGAALYVSELKPLPENASFLAYKYRQATIREHSKALLSDSDYLFCLEAGVAVVRDTYWMLLHYLTGYPEIMIAAGVMLTQWSNYGNVWLVDNIQAPVTVQAQLVRKTGMQYIDLVDLRCCITRTYEYKHAPFSALENGLTIGMEYALGLRQRGWKVIVDWDVNYADLVSKDLQSNPDGWVSRIKGTI